MRDEAAVLALYREIAASRKSTGHTSSRWQTAHAPVERPRSLGAGERWGKVYVRMLRVALEWPVYGTGAISRVTVHRRNVTKPCFFHIDSRFISRQGERCVSPQAEGLGNV